MGKEYEDNIFGQIAKMADEMSMELDRLYLNQKEEVSEKGTGSCISEEEILALGLYPKNENYKMALISKILGKIKG